MVRVVLARVGVTLVTALLTDKFIINALVLLLEWLASKTSNDMDDRLVQVLKESLDKRGGKPVNLYQEVKQTVQGRKE